MVSSVAHSAQHARNLCPLCEGRGQQSYILCSTPGPVRQTAPAGQSYDICGPPLVAGGPPERVHCLQVGRSNEMHLAEVDPAALLGIWACQLNEVGPGDVVCLLKLPLLQCIPQRAIVQVSLFGAAGCGHMGMQQQAHAATRAAAA